MQTREARLRCRGMELTALEPERFLDPAAYRPGPLDFPMEGIDMEGADVPGFDGGTTELRGRVDAFLRWVRKISGASGALLVDAHGSIVAAMGTRKSGAEGMALRLAGQMERTLRVEPARVEGEPGAAVHAECAPGLLLALLPLRFRSAWFGLGLLLAEPLEESAGRVLALGWKGVLRMRV